jgi:hypothetical protein
MSGGGKGGSQTTEVKIPEWLQQAAKQNIARADVLSTIGYTPYYGPDVAAFTPQQLAAMQGTNQAAAAFGMPTADPTGGMPQAYDFNGMSAYSSGPMFNQALAELQANRPGQYAALTAPFIDPVTGAAPLSPFGPLIGGRQDGGARGESGGSFGPLDAMRSMVPGFRGSGSGNGMVTGTRGSGGYTGFRDMFDGGGPGQAGPTFSGGLLSGTLNTLGVNPATAAAQPKGK